MKYCDVCDKEFDTEENLCPVCKSELSETADDENNEYEAAEIISTMMMTGIL